MNIQIVEPKKEDAYVMIDVRYKAWLVTYPNKKAGITADDIEQRYKDAFSEEKIKKMEDLITDHSPDEKMFLAKDGEMVVGVCFGVIEEDKNKLEAMYVLPEHHNQGIGTKLWNKLLPFFENNKDIYVEVADYNNRAISFYKKLGFVDTGRRFSDERFRMKSGGIITEMEMVIKSKENQS